MNKRLRRVLRRLVLPHQSEVAVQFGLQRVKANVSSPNSFSTMTKNQYTGVILHPPVPKDYIPYPTGPTIN